MPSIGCRWRPDEFALPSLSNDIADARAERGMRVSKNQARGLNFHGSVTLLAVNAKINMNLKVKPQNSLLSLCRYCRYDIDLHIPIAG